jgi:type VI secretion system protein ImpH
MPLRIYESVLPGQHGAQQLRDWVRGYVGIEFDWDLQLVLHRDEVPALQLGGATRLGWTSWLGQTRKPQHRSDYRYAPEHHHRVSSAAAGRAAANPSPHH